MHDIVIPSKYTKCRAKDTELLITKSPRAVGEWFGTTVRKTILRKKVVA